MRASELLGTRVVDRSGEGVGAVRDLLVAAGASGDRALGHRPRVVGLIVDEGGLATQLAHAWGYAEGRSTGPAPLAKLAARAAASARYVAADQVGEWGPDSIRLRVECAELGPWRKRSST